MESAPSRAAMLAAVARGLLRLEAAAPWVLDDALALVLVGSVWRELREQLNLVFPGPVSGCGLTVVDHPARADLQQRYFANRADGLRPYTAETLVAARVT